MPRCPSGKRHFPTRELAKRWLKRLQSTPRAITASWDDPATEKLAIRRVYRCSLCHGFHLTSQPRRRAA